MQNITMALPETLSIYKKHEKMTPQERREKMCRFRDYGIWVVAVLLIANFILWYNHDKQVMYEIKPRIENNTKQIQMMSRHLDSTVKVADSVFRAVELHHQVDLHK